MNEHPSKSYMNPEASRSPQTEKNFVLQEDGAWAVHLEDGTTIAVPERLGKIMYVAAHLMNAHMKKHEGWTSDGLSNVFTEASLKRFDCHTLVAAGLGLLKDLGFLKSLSYTASKRFFQPHQYRHYSSAEEFTEAALASLGEEKIGVVQQVDTYQGLTHGFFVFTGQGGLYTFHRAGRLGELHFEKLQDEWTNLLFNYGDRFAIAPYAQVASSKELQDYYAQPHWDD